MCAAQKHLQRGAERDELVRRSSARRSSGSGRWVPRRTRRRREERGELRADSRHAALAAEQHQLRAHTHNNDSLSLWRPASRE